MSLHLVDKVPERTCAFCGKDEGDAEGMIAGPQIYICYGCVDLAAGLVLDARERSQAAALQPMVRGDLGPFPHSISGNAVFIGQRGRCFYCEILMTGRRRGWQKNPTTCTRDHFIPRSARAAVDTACNTVWACLNCNQEKGDRMPTPAEARKYLQLMALIGRKAHPLALDIAVEV